MTEDNLPKDERRQNDRRRIIIVKEKEKRGGKPKLPNPNFLRQAALAALIFLLLVSIYTALTGGNENKAEISISELAQDISRGSVTSISVKGDELTAEYKDGTEKVSKKEEGTALTTTLANYKVSADA